MATDTLTLEMLKGTAVFREAEERLEAEKMNRRRAAIAKLEEIPKRYLPLTIEANQRVVEAKAVVADAQAQLLNARTELAQAEGASLGLSVRSARETAVAEAELKRLLPDDFDSTIQDLRHRLHLIRNELHGREYQERKSWMDNTLVTKETSNAHDVNARVAEVLECINSMERARTELHTTDELVAMVADARRRFQLDHMEGVRYVTVKHI